MYNCSYRHYCLSVSLIFKPGWLNVLLFLSYYCIVQMIRALFSSSMQCCWNNSCYSGWGLSIQISKTYDKQLFGCFCFLYYHHWKKIFFTTFYLSFNLRRPGLFWSLVPFFYDFHLMSPRCLDQKMTAHPHCIINPTRSYQTQNYKNLCFPHLVLRPVVKIVSPAVIYDYAFALESSFLFLYYL